MDNNFTFEDYLLLRIQANESIIQNTEGRFEKSKTLAIEAEKRIEEMQVALALWDEYKAKLLK